MNCTAMNRSLVGGLIPAAACHAAAQAAPPAYAIISLGTNTSGLAVSPNGTYVTGYDFITGDGFVWTQAGGKQEFSHLVTIPSRPFAEARGVTDSGVAAGSIQGQSWGSWQLPVMWTGTTAAHVSRPAGVEKGAIYGINSAGTMAGTINVGSDWYATVYSTLLALSAAGFGVWRRRRSSRP